MSVTADGTLWTADTTCVTADGRVICIAADVAEPVRIPVTADTTRYTADNTTWPTADGGVGGATDILDAIVEVAGAVLLVEPTTALDQLDADVVSVEVPIGGGAHYPRRRPLPVVGYGFGILPQLEGEAHGVVGVAGAAAGVLPGLAGEATGAAGITGRSAGQLLVRAMATGARGTRGSGSGMIVKFSGSATGQQDDDEAAVIAFLLAA